MKEIVKIFERNFDMTRKEATDMYDEMHDQVMEAVENGDLWEIDNILADYGLEPDYIMDIIGY